jgi:hypothetical protein
MGAFSWQLWPWPFRTAGTPRRPGLVIHPRPFNLLPGHGAFTNTKEPGTRLGMDTTRAVNQSRTTEGCSSFSPHGILSADVVARSRNLPASSFTARGSYMRVTGDRGGSGEPRELADSAEE